MDSHHIPLLSDVLGDDGYLLAVQKLGGSGMHPLQTGWRWVAVVLDEEGVEVTTGLHLDPPCVCSVECSRNLKYNRKAAPLSVLLFLLLLVSFACPPQTAMLEKQHQKWR